MRYRVVKIRESLYNLLMSERGTRRRLKGTTMTDIVLRHYTDEELIGAWVTNNITTEELDDLRPGLRTSKKYRYIEAD